jgi:hypothetical protein
VLTEPDRPAQSIDRSGAFGAVAAMPLDHVAFRGREISIEIR